MDTESGCRDAHGRPYRSHLHPACFPCRARKSRCKTTRHASAVCDMCHAQGTDCVFPPQGTERPPRRTSTQSHSRRNIKTPMGGRRSANLSSPSHPPPPRTRSFSSASPTLSQRVFQSYTAPVENGPTRHGSSTVDGATPGRYPSNPSPSIATHQGDNASSPYALIDMIAKTDQGSSHVVSPAIAEDDSVFREFFSNGGISSDRASGRMIRVHAGVNDSTRRTRPILFNTVPKRGKRESDSRSLAASSYEIIERLVEPYQDELINLFFEKVNISFPIFDEVLFRRVYVNHRQNISPTLLCHVYGNVLIYWPTTPRLAHLPSPDHYAIWRHTENSFSAEFVSTPAISKILTILLNISGRPSTHQLGNGGILGMAIAYGNAFGLNRDPSDWNLSPSEKKFRIRIWWLLVVFDRWTSLACGTPPMIHRTQYDVPVPVAEDLYNPITASSDQIFGASCFVALTTLSEVLSHCLKPLYRVRKKEYLSKQHVEAERASQSSPFELENLLADWEDSLNDDLRRLVIRGTGLRGPGVANLRLAYLSVKFLIRRSQLDWDRVSLRVGDIESPHYIRARRASEEIVDFVRELDETHLGDFWIPLHAYSLTSATTFLLRSALNSKQLVPNTPLRLARSMIDTLQLHRRNHAWDIADNCLSNCSDLVDKIEVACMQASNLDHNENVCGNSELQESVFVDLNMDMEALDGLFPRFGSDFE